MYINLDFQTLFDPVNPDKDTQTSQRFTRTERLDNEFWLLQKLEDVMEKANFYKLSDDTVNKALRSRTTQGIRVSRFNSFKTLYMITHTST